VTPRRKSTNSVKRVSDNAALRSSRKVAPDISGLVSSAISQAQTQRKLTALIKGLVFKIENVLQGDYEFHK